MPAFALPESLEAQLDDLAAEVRRLRILRGASWLVTILFAAPLLAIALDASFELPGRARGALLAGWLALALVAAWWFVVRRIRETQSAAALAALLEAKFPSLAERLCTLVELSANADAGNGSRTMMALLARETERRTRKLDFSRAAPSGFSFRFAALTACAAVLALAPILFVSGGGERVRRLVAPWSTPPVEVAYEVVVSSGDPVVKRGQSITVSGYLRKTRPNAVFPDAAAAIFREPGSAEEKKLPMTGDDKSAFTLTRPTVATDLEYCIESGSARSAWHTIAAVDPVEIAAGSEVTISPPDYAAAARPKRTMPALADLEALQHSRADVKLKLNRKAQAVQVVWRPVGAAASAPVERIPAVLEEAGTAVSVELPLKVDGTLKLILFAEKDVRTEVAVAVRVQVDVAPKFERVTGLPAQPRDIRGGEVLDIDFAALDDIAVSAAFLEYGPADAIDDTTLKSKPIAATGLATPRATGGVQFCLPPNAAEGQTFRVRLRVLDNRSIPELDWRPQSATYPDGGWAIFRVASAAKPLAEQEIAASNDGIRQKLDAIAKLLEKAHADMKGHRLDFRGQPKLEQDQSVRLADDLEAVRAALVLLDALTRDTAGVAELRALAALVGKLAEGEVRTAELHLKKVITEAHTGMRDTAALAAQHALDAALVKLAALRKAADLAAANRFDIAELDRLAREQARLAEDAKRTKDTAALAAEQTRLRGELEKLLRESEALRKGGSDAAAQRKKDLAVELAELAQSQTDLDAAIARRETEANRDGLDELAKKQKDIADRVKALADRTDLAARVAQTGGLDPKSARAATDFLNDKKPLEALTEQEKAARDLERLADALEKAAGERSDTRKAVQQLARWQEDLRRRVADGLRQAPRGDSPPEREKWAAEQAALRDATKKLSLPPSPALEKSHAQAAEATAQAAEQLGRDAAKSGESLKKAADALNQLAEKAPTQQQRAKAAAAEADKLRRESDTLSKEAEEIARAPKGADDYDAKRKALAEKRRELAKKIAALDAPGSERRRAMAAEAADLGAEETAEGQSKESAAAQADAKRQLDRLKQSLEGQTPADDRAAELAGLQKELTRTVEKLESPKPEELERLRRAQAEIARQLRELQAPEEQKALQDAREAAQVAEAAPKKSDAGLDELKKKSRQASASVQQLADKLNGGKVRPSTPAPEDASADLPGARAAKEARDLAAEQRSLREQLARVAEKGSKPPQQGHIDALKGLAQEQKELAEAAGELARESKAADKIDAAAKAEEAARKAHGAGRKLDVGDAEGARKDADDAAVKLGEAGAMAGKPELAQKANELRKKQEDLTREAVKSAGESGAARQRGKQQELAKAVRDLAGKMEREGQSEKPLQDVADALKKAGAAMDQASRSAGNNKPGEAAGSRKQASDALAQSRKAMEGSGGSAAPGADDPGARAAAESGKRAGELMKQAEGELSESNGAGAGASMQKAAEKLKDAAGKLGIGGDGTGGRISGPKAAASEKSSDPSAIPNVVADNLGKPWGDLPGDVKSKITQELKAKYGDDYARIIKLYFEQLAERK